MTCRRPSPRTCWRRPKAPPSRIARSSSADGSRTTSRSPRPEVAIRNALGQYMSSTGAFTSTTVSYRTAFLNSPGSPGSNFSYTTPVIPPGSYTVLARGVDQHGFATPVPSQRNVTVSGTTTQLAARGQLHVQLRAERLHVRRPLVDRRERPDADLLVELRQRQRLGPVPIRTYTSPNAYTVTLTVRDENGLTSAPSRRRSRSSSRLATCRRSR